MSVSVAVSASVSVSVEFAIFVASIKCSPMGRVLSGRLLHRLRAQARGVQSAPVARVSPSSVADASVEESKPKKSKSNSKSKKSNE